MKKIYVPFALRGKRVFRFDEELEGARQQYRAGFHIGVVDALFLCLENRQPVPRWVADNFASGLNKVLGVSGPKGKGQKAREIERLRIDIKHFDRWDAIQRAKQSKAAKQSTEKLYRLAQNYLNGTTSWGRTSSLKRSCKIVEKEIAKPNGIARFRRPRSAYVRDAVWKTKTRTVRSRRRQQSRF